MRMVDQILDILNLDILKGKFSYGNLSKLKIQDEEPEMENWESFMESYQLRPWQEEIPEDWPRAEPCLSYQTEVRGTQKYTNMST